MPLSERQVGDVLAEILPLWAKEKHHLDSIDDYLRGEHPKPYVPREASAEYRTLADRATTNLLPLVVDQIAQLLFIEGYRPSQATENAAAWEHWQANGMDARQSAIYRAALSYGIAFMTVLPGTRGSSQPAAVMRGVSPRKMIAVYDDPAEDEWPLYALHVIKAKDRYRLRLLDETSVYHLRTDTLVASKPELERVDAHDQGVTPVVRFCNVLDLDGRYTGEVEPLLRMQDRLNQTTFDRLLVQTFGSWKIRTISGMVLPADTELARQKKLQIAQDRFLTADDADTRFGQLDETPLDGFIAAAEHDVRDMASRAQVPPHALMGDLSNLAADAIAEARSGLDNKVVEKKHSFGESAEQGLRLAALAAGDEEGASDYSAEVSWRDMGARSLQQAADALGKIATMLEVPPQGLWERIPGVTQTDVERWKVLAAERDSIANLLTELRDQAAAGGQADPNAPGQVRSDGLVGAGV